MTRTRAAPGASLSLAASFLTAIPLRTAAPQPGDLGRAAVWFPFIGLALGVVLSLTDWLAARYFGPLLAGALTVTVWAALTGGLHLDGLADCGDGLLSAAAPERRLEIMRDPRLGAFGVISLVLFLVLKVLALAALPAAVLWGLMVPGQAGPGAGLFPAGALVLAPVVARWLLLWVARQPSARPDGMGQSFAAGLSPRTLALAAALPLLLSLLAGPRGWLAALLALAVAASIIRLARARLGGVTGDVFGLTVELTELAILLTLAAHPVTNS